MISFFIFALALSTSNCASCELIADTVDLPRPFLNKHAYMEKTYTQAKKAGATKTQIERLRYIAHGETRGNPRLCVLGGCGPFQHEIHSLVPNWLPNSRLTREAIRWLLMNKPGYSATTALHLLRGCEKLAGEEWRCCYGGAYRPTCRIKWDKTYQQKMM